MDLGAILVTFASLVHPQNIGGALIRGCVLNRGNMVYTLSVYHSADQFSKFMKNGLLVHSMESMYGVPQD